MSVGGILKLFQIVDQFGNPVTIEKRDERFNFDIHDEESRRLLEQLLQAQQDTTAAILNPPAVSRVDPTGNVPPLADVMTQGLMSTLGDTVTLPLNGHASAIFTQVAQSGTSTATFEASTDGGRTWNSVFAYYLNGLFGGQPNSLDNTLCNVYFVPCAGYTHVRVRLTSITPPASKLYIIRAGFAPQNAPITANTQIMVQQSASFNPWGVAERPAILAVTQTGLSGAAVTATLPAAGVGTFHYITLIQIVKFAAALLTAGTTPVLVTTTNMPGSPIFSFNADAAAAGTSQIQQFEPAMPIGHGGANTATTIVCPATTGIIWRVNVWYRADV